MDKFKEAISSQHEGKEIKDWEGTVLEYLYKVKKKPEICSFAPGRIYNMVMKYGSNPADESFKIKGYEDLMKYNFCSWNSRFL